MEYCYVTVISLDVTVSQVLKCLELVLGFFGFWVDAGFEPGLSAREENVLVQSICLKLTRTAR